MTQKIFVQKLSLFTTINNKNIDKQISHKRKRETQTQRENERHRVMQKETHIKTQIVRETTVKMKQQSEVDRQTREISNTL